MQPTPQLVQPEPLPVQPTPLLAQPESLLVQPDVPPTALQWLAVQSEQLVPQVVNLAKEVFELARECLLVGGGGRAVALCSRLRRCSS